MAWLELKFDLSRTADALIRIAEALERISPPLRAQPPAKPMRLITVEPYAIAEAEEEADRRAAEGTEGAE